MPAKSWSLALPLALSLLAAPVDAAPALFPPLPAEQTPRAQLARQLDGLGQQFLRARAERVAGIKTREALERRNREVAAVIRGLVGFLPRQRTPLAARVTGRLERDGFAVEKVIFESLPGFPVTANLYLPRPGKGPFPGILAPVGHGDLGKAGERRGPDLARKGFVVLVPDPLGQGERLQHYDPELRASRAGSSTDEHNQAATRASLVGDHVARFFLWDAMRALDYLVSRPEVDPARLGATGCSGGGTVATYLAALDDRVKAAAIACYLTDWEHLLSGPGPQEAEQTLPGFLKEGLDMGDYVALMAPRPLLIAATTDDFFPLAGARAVYEEGRRLYGLFEAADRISFFVGPGGHGTPRESREAISAFFLRWLGKGGDASEPPDPRLDPEELACTATGQVSTALRARTVADLVAEEAPRLGHGRKLPRTVAELTAHRRLFQDNLADIAVRPGGPAPVATVHRTVARAGYRLEVISFPIEKGPTSWGLLAVPEGTTAKPAVLLVDPRVRTTLADPGGDLDQLARAGNVVLALEPRGAAVEPEPSGRGSLLGSAAGLQRRAELVGRTLVGLRAEDVIRAVDLLVARSDVDRARLAAFGHGAYAVPLLHAAALDARLHRLALRDMLPVYRAVLDRSIHKNLAEIAIPKVLRTYDLDDLMVAIAPRPITLINPLDATGQPMPRRELDRHLGPAREAAKLAGGALAIVRKGTPALLLEAPLR